MSGLARDVAARRAAAAVEQDRLWRRHMELAEIGAIPAGGVNRQCLSAEAVRARAELIGWAEARGFAVALDDIANLFLRRPGTEPDAAPVVTGPHLDSQPEGGRFDGALGLPYPVMPSGAFHDARFPSEVCPTGMTFVPCERGISHNPAENARPEALAAGTRVLAATLVELAGA